MKIFALCAASAAAFTAKPTDGKFCCLRELNFKILMLYMWNTDAHYAIFIFATFHYN